MNHKTLFGTAIRTAPALLAIAAASFALNANAQSGQAYPSGDVNTSANPAPTPKVVKDAENSRAGQATERGVKKAGKATKKAGKKTASAIRNTGEKIGDKLPEGGAPNQNSQGIPNAQKP